MSTTAMYKVVRIENRKRVSAWMGKHHPALALEYVPNIPTSQPNTRVFVFGKLSDATSWLLTTPYLRGEMEVWLSEATDVREEKVIYSTRIGAKLTLNKLLWFWARGRETADKKKRKYQGVPFGTFSTTSITLKEKVWP